MYLPVRVNISEKKIILDPDVARRSLVVQSSLPAIERPGFES